MKLARDNTMQAKALDIYQNHLGNPEHRKLCIAEFQSKLAMKKSTAGTYYHLCTQKLEREQQQHSDKVIESKRARKFSAVKLQRGKDVASRVAVFFNKKEAEQYNKLHGYDKVVPGVQQPGKRLGIVS